MTDRNSDRDAFQPVGEGALVPDPALDYPADGQPTRQREASYSGGYPDATTDTDRTCVSWGHRSQLSSENAGSVSNTNSTTHQSQMPGIPSRRSVV